MSADPTRPAGERRMWEQMAGEIEAHLAAAEPEPLPGL